MPSNVGMSEYRGRERERERWRPGNRAAGVLSGRKGWHDPRFVALEFVREKKAMVRNGECGAEQEMKDSPRTRWLELS